MTHQEYFAARTFTFPRLSGPLNFDIFLRLGPSKYTRLFNRGEPLDKDRLNTYILKGTKYFYIHNSERHAFIDDSLKVLNSFRDTRAFDTEEAQQVLDEIAEQALSEIFTRHTFDTQTQVMVSTVVDTYVDLTLHSPATLPALLRLAKQKTPLMKHLVMTSIFATLLAKGVSNEDRELMFTAGYAGFVHDLGLSLLSTEIDEHSLSLSPRTFLELRKHPELGAHLLASARHATAEIRTAVLQHHEACDGSGYPRGLKEHEISLPARIVALTEKFSGLLIGSPTSAPLPPNLAAHAMAMDTKIDINLLQTFAKILKL